jgi:predicted porin
MKAVLSSLLSLVLAGTASAQSTVTVFGTVDTGVGHYSVKSTYFSNNPFFALPSGVPSSVTRSQTALINSGFNNGRLGFRGTEDLGGGLAASFWLDSDVSTDDGAKGINNFNRRSTVSLSGGFGELRLGRDYAATFWNDTVFSPLGTLGSGTNLIASVNANLALARGAGSTPIGLSGTDLYLRVGNSISYFLPANLGGFYGQFQYALPENVKSSDLPGTGSRRGRYLGARLGYLDGPLNVAISYGRSAEVDNIVAGVGNQRRLDFFNAGAWYDFGSIKLFGEISRVSDRLKTASSLPGLGPVTLSERDNYNGALAGFTVPIGPGLIRASYARVVFKNGRNLAIPLPAGSSSGDSSVDKTAIGYVHYLSKRTSLYASIARLRIKDGQNNPAIVGATLGGSPTFLSSNIGTYGYAPRSATGYEFGVSHSF